MPPTTTTLSMDIGVEQSSDAIETPLSMYIAKAASSPSRMKKLPVFSSPSYQHQKPCQAVMLLQISIFCAGLFFDGDSPWFFIPASLVSAFGLYTASGDRISSKANNLRLFFHLSKLSLILSLVHMMLVSFIVHYESSFLEVTAVVISVLSFILLLVGLKASKNFGEELRRKRSRELELATNASIA